MMVHYQADDVPGGTTLPPVPPRRRLSQLRRWLRWLFVRL